MLLKRLGQQDGGQRLKYGAQAAQTGLSHHITGVALLHDACKAEEEAGHQSAQHKRAPGIDAHHLSYIRIAAHRPGIETDGGLVIGHVSDDKADYKHDIDGWAAAEHPHLIGQSLYPQALRYPYL